MRIDRVVYKSQPKEVSTLFLSQNFKKVDKKIDKNCSGLGFEPMTFQLPD